MQGQEIESLFHYTNWDGLRGIITSNVLWATDFRWLNDDEELRAGKSLVSEWIHPLVNLWLDKARQENPAFYQKMLEDHEHDREKLCDDLRNHLSRSLNNWLTNGDIFNVFITSFCDHGVKGSFAYDHGYLSMWRAYGSAKSYAIEIDSQQLNKLLGHDSFDYDYMLYSRVRYNSVSHLSAEKASYEEYKQAVYGIIDAIGTVAQENFCMTSEQGSYLIDLFINTKHQGFFEEKEVRVAFVLGKDYAGKKAFEAERGNTIKPPKTINAENTPRIHLFEELKNQDKNFKLPIKRIIVGPHENKARHAEELRHWLDYHNRTDIDVTVSDIPFRGMK